MTGNDLIKNNKAFWLATVCAVAAFGLLNTVLGSQPADRVGTVSITQVLDDDLGSMVVEAARPRTGRVAHSNGGSTKHAKKGESAIELAVGI